jgi:hypothetical protein
MEETMSVAAKKQESPVLSIGPRRAEVLARIGWIRKAAIEELRAFWKTLNGKAPPALPRRTLEQRLIYQVQEQVYGGLSVVAKARLDAIADADARRADMPVAEAPVAGTRYIRVWRDVRYEVTATGDGFEWAGKKYKSLSAVAKAITGQHWNGRLFFGVGKHSKKGDHE